MVTADTPMGRKKRTDLDESRAGAVTQADLEEVRAALMGLAGEVASLLKDMQKVSVESVHIDGRGIAQRGLRTVGRYIDKIDLALKPTKRPF